MDRRLVFLILSAAALVMAALPASAQQKTAKQCNAEWTANKASIQASGKTKKAFVAECRGQATAAGVPTAPTTNPPRSSRSATRTQTGSVKTAKECSAEWTASKATIQASGKTKKAFMAECRGQTAAGAPPASAAPGPRTAATRTRDGNVKTAKECNAEWTANKASIQASGKTKKAFVAECRGQPAGTSTTTAAPSRAPSSAAPPTAGPTPSPPTRPSTTAPRTREATREPSAAGQFSNEGQAKARCPSDTVVWLNTESNVYHFAGGRRYGHTKSGAYMCERDAMAAGARAARNEKHP